MMKSKERPARFRPAVVGSLLLVLVGAWIWLIRGGSSPSAASASALQALCSGAGASGWHTAAGAAQQQAAGASPGNSSMQHIYVVGCGHSGTSLLKRTIGNFPGLRCLPMETWVWERQGSKPKQLRKTLKKWDRQAAEGNFTGWVEKTPRHVNHLEEIFRLDPSAKVVFIVRDGRDVAASLSKRGFPWADCMSRWVKDNSAALPFLDHPQLLTVKFEEFFAPEGVLPVLRQLSAFLGIPTSTERLLLSLQPPTTLLTDDEQCVAYASEQAKLDDLAASYMQQMSATDVIGGGSAVKGGEAPDPRDHKTLRSWQSSQAWAPQRPSWQQKLSKQGQADIEGNREMQRLMARFGYTDGTSSGAKSSGVSDSESDA